MPSHHDSAFKRLFGNTELVRALLELVPHCPAAAATGFERLNCSFVSSSERQRIADMVWRVYCGDSLFYLLLEFQSTVDPQMTQRMKVYAGLLCQDLYLQHKNPELLNLLPVVVYSGRRRWHEPNMPSLDWLKPLQEGKAFMLIDEESAAESVIGDVIRLVRASTLADVVTSLNVLLNWPSGSVGLRQDVFRIACERMALFDINQEPIMNKTVQARRHKEFTEEEYDLIWQMINDMGRALKEMPVFQQLLAARAEAKREGALEGRQEGIQEGRQEGIREGIREGIQEGWAEANRAILSKACLLHGGAERTATKIANASPEQLETWLDQLITGEKIEEIFREGSP